MNTPRLRSAYPSTPSSGQKSSGQNASASGAWGPSSTLPTLAKPNNDADKPMIPLNVLDAPSQRLYILFFYIGVTTWRFYDYFRLVSDETDSLWLFMKWVAIDSIFLYGLPGLRIPWLQWSSSTMTMLFVLHAVLNAFLMFRIPIPLEAWLIAFTKLLYDRELSVSERSVKPASILHNASLILGKQIIHILPEGSAMLNPDRSPFCIGDSKTSVSLPLRINQTNPVLIELLRIDLETNVNETVTLTSKEISKLKKTADKEFPKSDRTSERYLRIPIRKTGLYRLQKVMDESKFEVQRRLSDTLVVRCPTASMKSVGRDRCKGDLSDFYIQVDATPPFKIKYSKTVNKEDTGRATLNIHPEHLITPLARPQDSDALTKLDSPTGMDISWARTQSIQIPLNESLGVSGGWRYSIDELQDACGNVVKYASSGSEGFSQQKASTRSPLEQIFTVHERPRVALHGCDSQHPLKAEKGKPKQLPVQLSSTGWAKPEERPYKITYLFAPQASTISNKTHTVGVQLLDFTLNNDGSGSEISESGLYTLQSIESRFCSGEVLEPSSCLLLNPPEPGLEIRSETIPDKCADHSVGLMVDLDLTGTPPFKVFYIVRRHGGNVTPRVAETDHLHTQLELRPSSAGNYTYEFTGISDAVYQHPRDFAENKVLNQDVRPPASARFLDAQPTRKACIKQPVSLGIQISGDAPWSLDYDLVHNGRRQKHQVNNIETQIYELKTEKLKEGGDYTLALTGITDKLGCKMSLEQEAKITVGLQGPKVSFGKLEGKRNTLALEGKIINLPLKLQGDPPWIITYRNVNQSEPNNYRKRLFQSNDQIEVDIQGTYEIVDLHDATCPGSVDASANQFTVEWIPRPAIGVAESAMVEKVSGKYVKKDVCEGDQDATEITFNGTAPFTFEYDQRLKPDYGLQSKSAKKSIAGLTADSLKMETSQAGLYEYKFSKLGDSYYSHDAQKFTPLIVTQRVHPKPSARFSDAGTTYKYCKEEESGDEVIPVILTGLPPFHLEVEIRHHATTKPELVNIPYIETTHYNFHIPHRVLTVGTHAVTIRKVRDSRGCQRKSAFDAPHVQVSVADIPSISPLETQTNYCVGDRISYSLSGTPPFNVFYTFQGRDRKAGAPTTGFRRLAEKPGEFTITGVSDQRSTDACKARVEITKIIHEMPSVRVSKGRIATVDIHEGGEAEILFEFGGTPPFEFTYTRSTNAPKGKKSEILETKSEVSQEFSMTVRASDEGVYEVVSIKDRYCAFSTQTTQGKSGGQKLLMYR